MTMIGEDSQIYQILNPAISQDNLGSFSDVLNESWGSFYKITPEILKRRLESGELFIGSYVNKEPVGILETISLKTDTIPSDLTQFKNMARYVCSQVGDYKELTNDGLWNSKSSDSNVLVFVDVTVLEKYREKNYSGPSLFSGIIECAKEELKSEKMSKIKYATTFTPNYVPIIEKHLLQGAFDTEFVLKNARPGYEPKGKKNFSDVNFMCYMAPGFLAQAGQSESKKSA